MSPQFSRADQAADSPGELSHAQPPPAATPAPSEQDEPGRTSIEKPDFSVHITRPNAPKSKKDVPVVGRKKQAEDDHDVDHLKGNVVFEFPNATLKADAVDYDKNTGIATATRPRLLPRLRSG